MNGSRAWMERGACESVDPAVFFPTTGESQEQAKRICRGCEVRADCLDYALANDVRFGIWGAKNEAERNRERSRRRRRAS